MIPEPVNPAPGQHLRLKIAAAKPVLCLCQLACSQLMRLGLRGVQ